MIFVRLVILYKQSKYFLLSHPYTDLFDDDLFNTWVKEPHYFHNWYDYSGRHHYSSQWNSII
jgi:hypothetical protein